jgi:hypothetical protein
MVRTHRIEPDAARAERLEQRYGRWRELHATFRTWTL